MQCSLSRQTRSYAIELFPDDPTHNQGDEAGQRIGAGTWMEVTYSVHQDKRKREESAQDMPGEGYMQEPEPHPSQPLA
jgi:hypothetical protein